MTKDELAVEVAKLISGAPFPSVRSLAKAIIPLIVEECAKLMDDIPADEKARIIRSTYGSHES